LHLSKAHLDAARLVWPPSRLAYDLSQIDVCYRRGGATTCGVDFTQKALNLNSAVNAAIGAEIGERLAVLLSKEQSRPPPRIQHLLRSPESTGRDRGPLN